MSLLECLVPAHEALAWLLYAFWTVCVVLVFLAWRVPILHRLLAYGKAAPSGSDRLAWSWTNPLTWYVRHELFVHFYVVGVVETLALLILNSFFWENLQLNVNRAWTYFATRALKTEICRSDRAGIEGGGPDLVLVLFLLHTSRRLYEEITSLRTPSARAKSKMHISGYLVGVVFYALAPVSFLIFGTPNRDPSRWGDLLGWPRLLVGVFIFLLGNYHQFECHRILRELKGRKTYVIPQGDWFEFSSSAHYLAEFVVYAGLIVLAFDASRKNAFGTGVFIMYLFILCNLSMTAERTHAWYLEKFPDEYPKLGRARVIPWVF